MTTLNWQTRIVVTSVLLNVLFSTLSHGQSQAAETVESTCESEVLFFDDFSTSALDRSQWNVEVVEKPHNNEQQTYVDSPETHYQLQGSQVVGALNGTLVLHPRFKAGYRTPGGRTVDFVSSRINTKGKAEFVYGSIESRIKLPKGSGIWPAFWALGSGPWPATGEIDIMECVGEPDWTSVALHGPGYSGNTPLVEKHFFKSDEDVAHWHVYSVDWLPAELLFKVDGHPVYRVTRKMVEQYGEWVFDSPKYLILNVALGGTYPSKTNNVKLPYSGIPESTVELIQNDKAKMFVDWVRVTKHVSNAPASDGSHADSLDK
ncbi:glycoside hydrolase family 16 protein [Bythopirellula polymerisocia]|uniref:Beta-glucanase n=1 Tax=Bythopirellula polymerisocia TaxID=2528003 RepID=A0A5C6CRJ3_9BACT|nr:glycoside hydrolase family 16 protein [Bythopirellula polymerisocia]TWU26071.1 Beta-glucanase precursor [Bythopirellula polymerisocia]